jgi:BNR-Asp box repeat
MDFLTHAFRAALLFSVAACAAHAQNLPSGLAPVTQLSVGSGQVALDSNGSLFRSDDQGKHWKTVKQQWDGKVVELVGIPALTADKPVEGEVAAVPFAAVLLRSSTALHWVSVDRGKTWKPSNLDDVRRNDVKWSGN